MGGDLLVVFLHLDLLTNALKTSIEAFILILSSFRRTHLRFCFVSGHNATWPVLSRSGLDLDYCSCFGLMARQRNEYNRQSMSMERNCRNIHERTNIDKFVSRNFPSTTQASLPAQFSSLYFFIITSGRSVIIVSKVCHYSS